MGSGPLPRLEADLPDASIGPEQSGFHSLEPSGNVSRRSSLRPRSGAHRGADERVAAVDAKASRTCSYPRIGTCLLRRAERAGRGPLWRRVKEGTTGALPQLPRGKKQKSWSAGAPRTKTKCVEGALARRQMCVENLPF